MALHWPLLRLPYFWDEAGYYIPAARDLLLTGSLIPHSTPSNAHPPLVMAWLALCWKVAGYAPIVTRVAMLAVAAFAITGIFRLAQRLAHFEVALASTVCTALYPVFFAQSSMAHVDLAAAGLTFWALDAYFDDRPAMTAVWFSLAVMAKETAILAPASLLAWAVLRRAFPSLMKIGGTIRRGAVSLLVPFSVLLIWYAYHYLRTGFVFGNPEFFRYNVAATRDPTRIALALLMRLWQTFGYFNLLLLTVPAALSMKFTPVSDDGVVRERITLPAQLALLSVAVAYIGVMSVIGGAVLARYMLPAVPLVIVVCISTLRRRMRAWRIAVAVIALAFISGLFINPPYGFSPEDNLAYSDFIRLHRHAEEFLQARYPEARILTAWPASGELTEPELGYVKQPLHVVRIEDFTLPQLLIGVQERNSFDVAYVFSTKYDPPNGWFKTYSGWQSLKTRFFGYHQDLPPEAAAQFLGGRLVFNERRKGQWVGVIAMESVEDAKLRPRTPRFDF